MSNNSRLFARCIELLSQYKDSSKRTTLQKYQLKEVLARLKIESARYARILDRNSKLLEEDKMLSALRAEMTDEKVIKILREQAKKDSELNTWLESTGGNITRGNITEIAAFDMGSTNQLANSEEITSLNGDSESLYRNLWAIKTRLNNLREFKNFNPKGVRDVRNHLIDHAGSQNDAVIFSFGLSTQGPILRPIKPSGSNTPSDKGLMLNIEEFLLSIIKKLEAIAS